MPRTITMTIEVTLDEISEEDRAQYEADDEDGCGIPVLADYKPTELIEPIVDSLTPDNVEIWAGTDVYAVVKSARLISFAETV